MPFLDRIFAGDEELGKKDDDHRPRKGAAPPLSWSPRQSMPAFRRRRVFFALIACLLVYFFIHNLPTNLGPDSRRRDSRVINRGISSAPEEAPTGQPPRPSKHSGSEEYYYEGSIKFYKLAASLRAVIDLAGHSGANRNVLFAASGLKSASEIIPLACEMAQWKRNKVHFALMGRDDLNIEEVKELNGISDEDCEIYWHDARPDYSRWSSEYRMEVSVTASLGHLQRYVRPQVIITDHASREDRFFVKSIRSKATELGKSVIELPTDASENLMWLTRLDSGSLAAWHTTYVDLVIHAPPQSSGSLIRLMKSIEAADYFGSRRPHITIELPAEIDPPTLYFLENIIWPPIDRSGASHASQVTLRHRLPRYGFTTAEASTHFIESFYPARPKDSHVLLLSPQTELSPVYYHYIMYNLLEYKYSNYGEESRDSKTLMGFSLELPSLYLNNSVDLVPPTLDSATAESLSPKHDEPTPFLWQAPNCNAALYFGDKWVELHSYLSSRITIQDPDSPDDQKPPARQKVVSEYYPAWMEYVQELMRVREYSLLYPNFPESKDAIVTVHNELYRAPEEYKPSRPPSTSEPVPTLNPNDPFTIDPSAHSSNLPTGSESSLLTSSLMSLLPNSGDLPELPNLPILSFDGNILSDILSEAISHNFASDFRREIGQCNAKHKVVIESMSADDLFCNLDTSEAIENLDMHSEKESHQENDDSVTSDQKEDQEVEKKSQNPFKAPVKTSEKDLGRKAESISKRIEDKANDRLPHADETRLVQNEFTEHLRRQGVKPASDEATNSMGKKAVIKETSNSHLHIGKQGLMKERNSAFELVNGNLVKKEKMIGESEVNMDSSNRATDVEEKSSALVSNSAGKPANKEKDEDNRKESRIEEVKREDQKPAEQKGVKSSKMDNVQLQRVPVEEVAKQDEEVSSKVHLAPTETKSAAAERDRGW